MRKFQLILGAVFISLAGNAYGQKIAEVTCYSGGERPVQTYRGTLGEAEIIDLPQGGFNVKGRQITIRELNAPTMASICRSWYLKAARRTNLYRYQNVERGWNLYKIDTAASVQRMTCAPGSVVTEHDSTDAYKAEILRFNVETQKPSPGGDFSLETYYSGERTVSSSECVLFDF